MHWQVKAQIDSTANFLTQVEKILLRNRGVESQAQKGEFLNPSHPRDLDMGTIGIDQENLDRAVERLVLARDQGQTVVIYGDYDADGICATAILWQVLHRLGIKAFPFIPLREVHGYGLSQLGLETILEKYKPDLVVTVDNGIVAHQAAEWLYTQTEGKVDLVISDHHQVGESLPRAHSIVHSDQVCGTTVAWYLAFSFVEKVEPKLIASMDKFLDLVAIGTIADMMSMVGINRSFAKHGLEVLTRSTRPGIVALKAAASLRSDQPMTSYHVGFMLGPRINAMGRIDDGLAALRLLCTNRQDTANNLSAKLDDTNKARQDLTQEALSRAIDGYEAKGDHAASVIVLAGDYHEGIIGLIAGKLVEKYFKPSIVISVDGEVSKGSARSVPGVNIIELIRRCDQYLLGAGGHPAAAGLSIKTKDIDKFTQEFTNEAKSIIDPQLLEKSIEIDCHIPLENVSLELHQLIQQLAPFGLANPQPTFSSFAQVLSSRLMGQDGKHLKLELKQGSVQLPGVGFGRGSWIEQLETSKTYNFAYTIDLNHWQGETQLQLHLRDFSV